MSERLPIDLVCDFTITWWQPGVWVHDLGLLQLDVFNETVTFHGSNGVFVVQCKSLKDAFDLFHAAWGCNDWRIR